MTSPTVAHPALHDATADGYLLFHVLFMSWGSVTGDGNERGLMAPTAVGKEKVELGAGKPGFQDDGISFSPFLSFCPAIQLPPGSRRERPEPLPHQVCVSLAQGPRGLSLPLPLKMP